jgi:hypothetical protein
MQRLHSACCALRIDVMLIDAVGHEVRAVECEIDDRLAAAQRHADLARLRCSAASRDRQHERVPVQPVAGLGLVVALVGAVGQVVRPLDVRRAGEQVGGELHRFGGCRLQDGGDDTGGGEETLQLLDELRLARRAAVGSRRRRRQLASMTRGGERRADAVDRRLQVARLLLAGEIAERRAERCRHQLAQRAAAVDAIVVAPQQRRLLE